MYSLLTVKLLTFLKLITVSVIIFSMKQTNQQSYIIEPANPESQTPSPKLYIITGAPGTGKTSIIDKLSSRGYIGLEEVPRKLLKSKAAERLGISPFEDLKEFAHLVFEKMYEQYVDAQKHEGICFFDRALPDVFAYLKNSSIPIPEKYHTKLNKCNFAKDVFICPPWQEIYTSDSIRPYPFEETPRLHDQIVSIYRELSFNLIEIPKLSIQERADYVLSRITPRRSGFAL